MKSKLLLRSEEIADAAAPLSNGRNWFWLGLLAWFLLIFFHQRGFDSPTPVSRLDLIMAICLEGRLTIDTFEKNTPDKAIINKHYYSDKAPGTVILALIGSAPAIWLGRALGWTVEDKKLWLAASWAGCAVLDIILAAGFVCLVRLLWAMLESNVLQGSEEEFEGTNVSACSSGGKRTFKIALATGIFLIFGGMPWPYATIMFSHAQTIGCVAVGLWLLYLADPRIFKENLQKEFAREDKRSLPVKTSPFSRYLFWGGLAFGFALNSEYTVGLIVFGIPLILFWGRRRNWVPFLCGLMGPCLLIPLYSWAIIGVPWQLPYSYQASFPEMQKGLYAIQWPDATVAYHLLFSLERGLLFWCPFLVIAFIGYAMLIRKNARIFCLTYFLPLLQVIIVSGRVWDWPAGPTFSARYLAPIIPLLSIPCAFALRALPRIGSGLGFSSLIATGLATLTNATPDFNGHPNPLFDLNWPLAKSGQFNPSILSTLGGFSGWTELCIFFLIFALVLWVAPTQLFCTCQKECSNATR
jgi:hypothetical protein